MNKIIQFLFATTFLLALATPLAILVVGEQENISKSEKRQLKTLPEFSFDMDSLESYPKEFEDFFNDRYGLRSKLVEHNQKIKRSLFNKSPVKTVVLGDDDWMFLNHDKTLSDHIGLVPMNLKILTGWTQALSSRQAWLKQRGVEYFFVPIPNKMTVYPEKMPMRIRRHADKTMLDKLLTHLEEDEFSAYINLEPIFAHNKNIEPEQQLYFKTDTHWTKLGAFIAYQNIMQALREIKPNLEPGLTFDELVSSPMAKHGDVANMAAVGDAQREQSFDLTPKNKCTSDPKKMHAFTKTAAYNSTKRRKRVPVVNGCKGKKYTAIVMHDSFGSYVKDYFSESFRRVVYMSSFDFIGMDEFIKSESPDFFIDMRVERNVKRLLKPQPLLIKEAMEQSQ